MEDNPNRWNSTLTEILLVVLTNRSQLYIFSERYQDFVKLTNT